MISSRRRKSHVVQGDTFRNTLKFSRDEPRACLVTRSPDGVEVQTEALPETLDALGLIVADMTSSKDFMSARAEFAEFLNTNFGEMDSEAFMSMSCLIACGVGRGQVRWDMQGHSGHSGSSREVNAGSFSQEEKARRMKLCEDNFNQVAAIAYRAFRTRAALLGDEATSVYQMSGAMAASAETGWDKLNPFLYGFYSWLLQWGIVLYLSMDAVEELKNIKFLPLNIPLAVLVALYSYNVTSLELARWMTVHQSGFWTDIMHGHGDKGLWFTNARGIVTATLWFFDVTCSLVLPFYVLVIGILLVAFAGNKIEAAINAILFVLFIPLVDDEFPDLFGLDAEDLVQTYLVSEAIRALNSIHAAKKNRKKSSLFFLRADTPETDAERESAIARTTILMPVEGLQDLQLCAGTADFDPDTIQSRCACHIIDGELLDADDERNASFHGDYSTSDSSRTGVCIIDNIVRTTSVSVDAIFTKVEFQLNVNEPWQSDGGESYDLTWLRLHRLDGKILETSTPDFTKDQIEAGSTRTHEGVFIITDFVVCNDGVVSSLRMFRASSGSELLDALSYFSLWEVDPDAEKLLQKRKAFTAMKSDEWLLEVSEDNSRNDVSVGSGPVSNTSLENVMNVKDWVKFDTTSPRGKRD